VAWAFNAVFGDAIDPNYAKSSVRHARSISRSCEPNDDACNRLVLGKHWIRFSAPIMFRLRSLDGIGDRCGLQSVRGRMVASGGAGHLAAEESPGSIGQAAR